jgi:hypothetical protein
VERREKGTSPRGELRSGCTAIARRDQDIHGTGWQEELQKRNEKQLQATGSSQRSSGGRSMAGTEMSRAASDGTVRTRVGIEKEICQVRLDFQDSLFRRPFSRSLCRHLLEHVGYSYALFRCMITGIHGTRSFPGNYRLDMTASLPLKSKTWIIA